MSRRRALIATLATCLLAGCRLTGSSDDARLDWVPIWLAGDRALLQPAPATVLAFDPETGHEQWSFELPERTVPGIAEIPPPRLLCPPVSSGKNAIVIVDQRHLSILSAADGALRVRRSLPPQQTFGSRLCPAPFRDGTWLQLEERGNRLTRFDADGNRVWSRHLPRGPALGRPRPLGPTGKIALKTADALLVLDDEGRLLYERRLADWLH